MEELKRKTDIMLRSVLVSVGRTGLALRWLDKEYKSITYSAIPYQEMGFSSLEKYIKSIPEVATLSRDADGEYVVHGVPSEADKHVAKLIAKQKKPKRKAKAKARRPVHASMHKSGVGRSVALHRAPVRKSPQAAFSRVSVAPSRVGVAPSRFGTTPRFVPPRMMRAPGTNTSVDRNGVEQQIAQQIQQQAKNMVAASLNSSRTVQLNKSQPGLFASLPQQTAVCGNKINGMASNNRQVTVVSRQEEPPHRKNWKKKAKSQGSGPNWGGMEVTFESGHDNQNESFKRTVKVSNSPSAQVDSLSKEELEIYSRIKKMLEQKPKGIWLTRITAEYKNIYHEELNSETLENLKHLPHIARFEVYPGDNIIVYPPKLLEEKPKVSHTQPHQANGGSPQHIEIYTLRPQDLPEKGTATEVSISHVDSPAHFFIHYKHMWDSLDALSAELNEFFQNPSNGKDPLPSLKQGMFCCAQFTEDDAWYRARITEMKTQGDTPQAHVIYVDFGNNEILPVSRLRMLRREHAELQMIAVLCALDGALPTGGGKNWSTPSIERFQELCSASEVLHMRVVRGEGHHLYVDLMDSKGNSVADTLAKEGCALLQRDTDSSSTSSSTKSSVSTSSVTPSSSTDSFVSVTTTTSSESSSGQSSAVSTSDSARGRKEGGDSDERKPIALARPFLRHRLLSKDDESQKIPERVQIPDEDFLDVFVCNVHSTDNICVNLSGGEYTEKLLALEQSMSCHYDDSTAEAPVKAIPGSIYAVYSQDIHSDGLWYRVKVLKVKGDKAHIEYMDYGDKGVIPISSLRSIPSRFLELPFQACTVSLHGLPKTKNDEVLLKVKHMTLNKDIVAQVIQRDGNTASVELYDTSSEVDININAMLQRLVIPDVDMAPVLPKVGEQIEALVTYVTPEGHVFIQIPGGGTTRLNELMEDIAEHYSQPTKAAEFVSSPHKNKMCCAKCSDGVWYRAIVTNVLPDRQVEVQYVDFGNIEALPLASLREPTRAISHVNSLPFQALECKLEGTEKGLTEEQTETIIERDVLLEVVQMADVPLVRLFISSENEEDALVNVGEVLGLETEERKETHDEAAAAGIESTALEYNDDDKDSVTSESSTEACRPVEDGNMTTALLSKPWVDICILEAIDPSTFVFQCLELLQQKEELEEKMQKYYAGRSRTPFRDIRPGVFCAVYHVEDDMWYRAVVNTSFSPQQTCVRFADYGDFGLVSFTNLQALPDEFRELPPMAIQGCLHGVEPVGEDLARWSQEAVDLFGELTADKKLVAKPRGLVANRSRLTNEETKVSLELYDTSEGNEDVLIADVLVNKSLAKKINEG